VRMGCAGRGTAELRFALGRMAAELTPIYRRTITRATPGIPVPSGALR